MSIIDLGNPLRRDHPLLRGCVAFWLPMPNNSGGRTLFDLMGKNNGSLVNGPTWGESEYGKHVAFDGVDDYVSVADADALDIGTGDFSFAIAFRAASLTGKTFLYNQRVDGANFVALMIAETTQIMDFETWKGTTERIRVKGSTAISVGEWYLVVFSVVRSSASSTRVYLNGRDDTASASVSAVDNSLTAPIHFARWSGGDMYYTGDIALVGKYNRALSADEIAALHDEWRRGWPTILNRYDASWVFAPTGNRRRRVMVACGGY